MPPIKRLINLPPSKEIVSEDINIELAQILNIMNGEKLGLSGVFSVFQESTGQTITPGSWQKVVLDGCEFDRETWFDCDTNYRYTPKRAGVYFFVSTIQYTTGQANKMFEIAIYKNDVEFKHNGADVISSAVQHLPIHAHIEMNGDDDYVELFTQHNSTSSKTINNDQIHTYFSGNRVIFS